ncbi:MAG: hypothetical protein CMI18_02955 [Opitutaceae bacterium]|nr:hypothetical protein [Opitutaceae bacterium]
MNGSHHPISKTAKVTVHCLFIICGILFILDLLFFSEFFDKHAYFEWENWPGFYAVYGFVACVLLVLVSKYILRPLVMRDEDYYD